MLKSNAISARIYRVLAILCTYLGMLLQKSSNKTTFLPKTIYFYKQIPQKLEIAQP